ncbi:uncharacterized protein LOC119678986 [Teleopsis dalmanni]|uniref:uncharacterized protein LOC119678986 n=1 Tax=Teleopsis dalmanni TaxID=139649 RepID=UPI0018CD7DB2|nr:uncharacterized protein LOC119678986 [Teleopsis dalmanni]
MLNTILSTYFQLHHRHRSNDPLIFEENIYPYYGGLSGHFLNVRSHGDGIVDTEVLSQKTKVTTNRDGSAAVSAGAVTTAAAVVGNNDLITFEKEFFRIQLAAARLIALQEKAKRYGSFTAEDNRVYADSLVELGQAAQTLAKLQQSGKIKDFSMLLQPLMGLPLPSATMRPTSAPTTTSTSAPTKSTTAEPTFASDSNVDKDAGEQKVDEVTEQHFNESDLLPPNTDDPYEDVNDSVAVTAPKKDASVAEAKPVGLSIAGEGGVASSKPNAVALSGRNGLAVASPKATAIAGVSPEEAAAFSVTLPNRNSAYNQLVIKNKYRPSTPVQYPSYDDYDYSDIAPVRQVTRDMPIAPPTKTKTAAVISSAASDDLINKWKTIIAEDFASSPSIYGRSAHANKLPRIKATNKFALRNNSGSFYYIY